MRAGQVVVPVEERFLRSISVGHEGGCWLWEGSRSTNGYGRIFDPRGSRRGDRLSAAHRFAYGLLRGPVPDDLQIDHLCRVRTCVNPSHLEPVTNRQNIVRSPVAARRLMTMRCKRGHDLNEWGVLRVDGRTKDPSAGFYRCRLCDREDALAYHYAHRDVEIAKMRARRKVA